MRDQDTHGAPLHRKGVLDWFARHPIVGLIGTVASVASVVLSVLFFIWSRESRRLVYAISPSRTVLEAGDPLECRWRGSNDFVAGDITILQVALWNQGELAIKASEGHVLTPITVSVDGTILGATVTKSTNKDYTHFRVADWNDGRAMIAFDVLDEGDGGVLQFAVEGSPESVARVEGKIEGQESIAPSSTRLGRFAGPAVNGVIGFAGTIVFLGLVIGDLKNRRHAKYLLLSGALLTLLLWSIIYTAMCVLFVTPLTSAPPPFGW